MQTLVSMYIHTKIKFTTRIVLFFKSHIFTLEVLHNLVQYIVFAGAYIVN
jgi:hypothetical protein